MSQYIIRDQDVQTLERLAREYPIEALDAVRHLEVAPEPRELPRPSKQECPAPICYHYKSDKGEHLIF